MKPGDVVEILPEFLDEDDPNTTGIIIRESLWDDGYRSSVDSDNSWWVVLRGDKLVHHPIDTFRKIV